jgi:hypothetical protein
VGLSVQYPTDCGTSGGVSSSFIQRMTGVPSRGVALIGDQPSLGFVLSMMGWILRADAAFVCQLWN